MKAQTKKNMMLCLAALLIGAILTGCGIWAISRILKASPQNVQTENNGSSKETADSTNTELSEAQDSTPVSESTDSFAQESQESEEESSEVSQEESQAEESSEPEHAYYDFKPHAVEGTEPGNYIYGQTIIEAGQILDTYQAQTPICMMDDHYGQEPGIYTFRGNNFRNGPVYGTTDLEEGKFDRDQMWTVETSENRATTWSSYVDPATGETVWYEEEVIWTGNGWTGQPLMRQWTQEEKAHMNMYDWAKEKEGLVEVIYPSLDGNIYFLDVETGEHTRDNMVTGMTFKGAGALDPRGLPLLYVGSGFERLSDGYSSAFIIDLIHCEVLYEFGYGDDDAPRRLYYWDSSPLVCAETDQLIYPGEDGVLYILKLNTEYDEEAGTIAVHPGPFLKWTYRYDNGYYLGMEDSCVIYQHYLYVADNGSHLMCIDLETMECVWVQSTLDDTNDTPVLEIEEDGRAYIYISTSFHAGWRAAEDETVNIPIWKIDAETGEIVWHTDFDCYTILDISGGVQATIALGKGELEDYLYVPVSRVGTVDDGVFVCLSKKTGEIVWTMKTAYSWSSPVCLYGKDGKGYVFTVDSVGDVYLLDGLTGEVLDRFNAGSNLEASPAVFGNHLVVGTRGQLIYGISFK